jgi:hypothetical protein
LTSCAEKIADLDDKIKKVEDKISNVEEKVHLQSEQGIEGAAPSEQLMQLQRDKYFLFSEKQQLRAEKLIILQPPPRGPLNRTISVPNKC